ncbi:S8 family serine peptidase [Daejeonella sp. H1SJ63]|uniref:S8 family peptidase n=1 Tax=Daejeonella sp. H1SJ63 TaxID=3034145 RepID=UPI0023ECEFAB|nr:S8 family serine peptidase [Daejeonella sp. H1SJ63]
MKNYTLTFLILLQALFSFAQRDPSKEILVFFKEGVEQSEKLLNGQLEKTASLKKDSLKIALQKAGIEEAMLEIAMPRFKKADTLRTLTDGTIIRQLDMTKLFRIKVPEGKSKKELIEKLRTIPEVLYAEENGTISPLLIPSDVRYTDQWALNNPFNPGADIHAQGAWDIFTGNPDNIIAVIDGGTDVNHPDLNDKIAGADAGFGWGGHGIHVSGIAAAESNNTQGVSGVDWQARILARRIDNLSDDADTYQAIVDAVNFSSNVRVLNHSWGTLNPDQTPGRYSTTIAQAFAIAYKANRVSVAAMGNHQQTYPGVVNYPAGFNNVIAVGATDNADVIANFSVHGNNIDVSAPGVGILSTLTNNGYINMDGTSMAAPHVSGIASLLKGFNAALANDDIENIIKISADDVNAATLPGFDNAIGHGRVNAAQALGLLQSPNTINHFTATGSTVASTTDSYTSVFYAIPGLAPGTYVVKRYEVTRAVTFPYSFCNIAGAWGRGVGTTGYSVANPNYGEGFCEVVPGTLTNTSATLRTYVYEVFNVLGQSMGYYPATPSNVLLHILY